jgi:cleavage and polyadenylation specificity factor subunit 1
MWTVGSGAGGDGEHAFLILSRRDSSMVLETGQEINELDSSGFCTAGPPVFAGNLGANRFIVQVTADSVRLLQHTELVQELKLKPGAGEQIVFDAV